MAGSGISARHTAAFALKFGTGHIPGASHMHAIEAIGYIYVTETSLR